MNEFIHIPTNLEYQKYFNRNIDAKYPAGCNVVLSLSDIETTQRFPGFVHCPAVIGVYSDRLWVIHHHFESRLNESISWPVEIPNSFYIFGVNLERMMYAKTEISIHFPSGEGRIELCKLEQRNLVSELHISKNEQGIKLLFMDPFNAQVCVERTLTSLE